MAKLICVNGPLAGRTEFTPSGMQPGDDVRLNNNDTIEVYRIEQRVTAGRPQHVLKHLSTVSNPYAAQQA